MPRMTCYADSQTMALHQAVVIVEVLPKRTVKVRVQFTGEIKTVAFDSLSPMWSEKWHEDANCLTNEQVRSKIRPDKKAWLHWHMADMLKQDYHPVSEV